MTSQQPDEMGGPDAPGLVDEMGGVEGNSDDEMGGVEGNSDDEMGGPN